MFEFHRIANIQRNGRDSHRYHYNQAVNQLSEELVEALVRGEIEVDDVRIIAKAALHIYALHEFSELERLCRACLG